MHAAVSAGTHVVAKAATAGLPWPTLLTVRLVASAIVFALVLALGPGLAPPPRRLWGRLLLFGFIAGPANQGFFLAGVNLSHASHASLLYALTPIGVYLAALALGRERASRQRLIGACIALFGVAILLVGGGIASGTLFGDLLLALAVAAWVAWTLEAKTLAAELGGVRTAGWALIAGGLWGLLFAPFTLDLPALAHASVGAWSLLGYLVLVTSVLSYILWNFALGRIEASRVAIFTNLQPVGTAILSAIFLAEPMGWPLLVGGPLVLLGIRVAQR